LYLYEDKPLVITDMEGSDSGLIWGTSPEFAWRYRGKPWTTSGHAGYGPRVEQGISWIQVRRVTAFVEVCKGILMLALRARNLIGTHEKERWLLNLGVGGDFCRFIFELKMTGKSKTAASIKCGINLCKKSAYFKVTVI